MFEFERRLNQAHSNHPVTSVQPDRAATCPPFAASLSLVPQQSLGNQASQRFAQSCPLALPSPSLCPLGGACHACPVRVQAKLKVGSSDDKYEQEADRVAEQVMRIPEPRIQRQVETEEEEEETLRTKPLADQITPLVQRQVEPEEEEEKLVQTKLADGALLQRQEVEEPKEEEEPIQAKLAEGGVLQRQEEEPEEEEEEPVQTKRVGGQTPQMAPGLEAQIRSLEGGGQPLRQSVRNFFEPRFGYDFSRVRVHTDGHAAEKAQTLNARAFTVGRDIVFGTGHYAPGTAEGKQLLAHELAHVVQQTAQTQGTRSKLAVHTVPPANSPQSRLQRQPKRPAVRKDVVLLMSPGLRAEAAVLAPGAKILTVSSANHMAKRLKKVTYPIKRLVIISHSLASGDLGFQKGKTTTYVRPAVLAAKLKGTVPQKRAPELIDFRGCSLGSSPVGMEKIRAALGAAAAIAGNCFMITHIQGPISINGTKITRASQVTKARRQAFETGFKMLIDSFGKAKKCILDKSKQAYFRARGKLVAQWASPFYGTHWDDRKSRCYKDLTVEKVDPAKVGSTSPGLAGHCKLIKIEKTP